MQLATLSRTCVHWVCQGVVGYEVLFPVCVPADLVTLPRTYACTYASCRYEFARTYAGVRNCRTSGETLRKDSLIEEVGGPRGSASSRFFYRPYAVTYVCMHLAVGSQSVFCSSLKNNLHACTDVCMYTYVCELSQGRGTFCEVCCVLSNLLRGFVEQPPLLVRPPEKPIAPRSKGARSSCARVFFLFACAVRHAL